jgi:hypothetical protein
MQALADAIGLAKTTVENALQTRRPGGTTVPTSTSRRTILLGVTTTIAAASLARSASAQATAEPLPSWNDGPAKQAILDFVRATTTQSDFNFVAPDDRIATFNQHARCFRASVGEPLADDGHTGSNGWHAFIRHQHRLHLRGKQGYYPIMTQHLRH